MEFLILLVAGGLILFFIVGFGLAIGSLFSTVLKALYNLAEGSSCNYTPATTYTPESELPKSFQGIPVKRYMRYVDENYMDMTYEELLDIPTLNMTDAQYRRYKRYLDWHSPRPAPTETETAAKILPQPEAIPPPPPLPKVKPRYRLPVDISDIQHMSVIHMTDEQFARYMSHFQQASDNRRRYIDSLH